MAKGLEYEEIHVLDEFVCDAIQASNVEPERKTTCSVNKWPDKIALRDVQQQFLPASRNKESSIAFDLSVVFTRLVLRTAIFQAIDRLPSLNQRNLMNSVFERLEDPQEPIDISELAKSIGKSVSDCETLLTRAVINLRKELLKDPAILEWIKDSGLDLES